MPASLINSAPKCSRFLLRYGFLDTAGRLALKEQVTPDGRAGGANAELWGDARGYFRELDRGGATQEYLIRPSCEQLPGTARTAYSGRQIATNGRKKGVP